MYFDGGTPRYLSYSDEIKSCADARGLDVRNFTAWISPSCVLPTNTSPYTVPGCSADWTFNQVFHLAQLGYGGLYVYLANGFDSEHRDQLLLALWVVGNLTLADCPRPRTYGDLRTFLSDDLAVASVLTRIRLLHVPTHLPYWEWVD